MTNKVELDYIDTFKQAYRYRLNNNFEKALDSLVILRVNFSVNSNLDEFHKDDYLRISKQTSIDFAISYLSLEISMTRKLHGFEEAKNLIAKFGKFEPFLMVKNGFWQMENGLTHFALTKYSTALEYFLAAKLVFTEKNYKRWSIVNVLLCKENLGQSLNEVLHNVDQEFKSEFEIVENQLKAFYLRYQFRNGDLSSLLSDGLIINSQPGYYQAWIKELPYTKTQKNKCFDDLISSQNLMSYRYRYNTLLGYIIDDDFYSEAKPSEMIDRLYLWVWRWLVSQTNDDLKKALRLLCYIDVNSDLTMEDNLLLANSLLWLRLFSYDHASRINKLLQGLSHCQYSLFPVLEMEKFVIQYWQSIKNRDEIATNSIVKSIESHPLFNSNEILLSSLWKSNQVKQLEVLNLKLREFIPSEESNKKVDFLINERAGQIINYKTNEIIRSDQLSKACKLLFKDSTIHEEEFAYKVLGLFSYDQIDHKRRIHALLSRLRKIFSPELSFGIKEERVFVEGTLPNICLISHPSWQHEIDRCREWYSLELSNKKSLKVDKNQHSERIQINNSTISRSFSRPEIERMLGKSRSSTGRLLSRLEKEEKLTRNGKARSTTYILKPEALAELQEARS